MYPHPPKRQGGSQSVIPPGPRSRFEGVGVGWVGLMGKLLAAALLALLLVALAVAAVGTLGWVVGGSAVVGGLGYAAYRVTQGRDGPRRRGSYPESPQRPEPTWTPSPRKRDSADE